MSGLIEQASSLPDDELRELCVALYAELLGRSASGATPFLPGTRVRGHLRDPLSGYALDVRGTVVEGGTDRLSLVALSAGAPYPMVLVDPARLETDGFAMLATDAGDVPCEILRRTASMARVRFEDESVALVSADKLKETST